MIATAIYWLKRLAHPPTFVITVRNGVARRTKGTVPAQWIADCTTIAADFGIARGHVEGVCSDRGLGLRFSPDVPARSHQRFRNVFAVHRMGKG